MFLLGLGHGKDEYSVAARWRIQLHIGRQVEALVRARSSTARRDRDVLPAINPITDSAARDPAVKNGFPQYLSGLLI